MSISNYIETKVMDSLFNNVAATGISLANRYMQLHTADPTDTGTVAVALETTRKSITSASTTNGVFTSVNDLIWTNVAGTETYSHVSLWDALTAGNCLWTGALTTPKAVVAGDTFTIATGSLTVTLD